MKLKKLLLLEPVSTPHEVLNGTQYNLKDNKTRALLVYAAGILHKKHRVRFSSLHSIPLSLAQISSIVKEEGVLTYHIPFLLDVKERYLSDKEIEKKISSYDFDQVWMTVGGPEPSLETLRYAKIVKRIGKKISVMVGGMLPSMYPEFFLKHQEIDYLIRGPAEVAVKQYASNGLGENYKNIQGFCYKTETGKINISPSFAIEPDLNKIPPCDFKSVSIDDYMKDNHYCNIQSARGCPYNCPFCSHTRYWGLSIKYRPLKNVMEEMRVLEEHGCNSGYMVDSIFTMNKVRLRRFVEAFEKQKISIKLWFETRADHFSNDVAKLCSRFNTVLVGFGAESGSPTVLQRLRGKDHEAGHKHIKNLFKAVEIAKKYDLLTIGSWVIGLPGETKDTIEETKKVIMDLTERGLTFSDVRILQIFPGTDYWDNPEEWGLKITQEKAQSEYTWDKHAQHGTESLTAQEIVEGAEEIREKLFQLYLTNTRSTHI